MSINPIQTHINQNTPIFLLANASTLNAGNINTNNLSTGSLTVNTLNVDTLVATSAIDSQFVSTFILSAGEANVSTLFTQHIILDQATLDVINGNTLLLNGQPIATLNNLSSIADWSVYPAFSTVFMNGQNLTNAGNITCQNLNSALNVQADTFTAGFNLTSPNAIMTNLRTTNLSTTNIVLSNLNGTPYVPTSLWATQPATSNVNLNGFGILGGSNLIVATSNLTLIASNAITTTCDDFNLTADEGANIASPAFINLLAQNGTYGEINLTANGGFCNAINGAINLTANGASLGGIGQGGSINLTANTPLGLSNLTSKISLSASGINSYAGVVPALASAFGYNFVYGSAGVYIAGGLPPGLPNTAGTTYIYGTNGIEMPSDAYMKNIYPYFDSITTPPDLNIQGRFIVPNVAQVCVNLSNVRNLDFQSNVLTRITNIDSIGMSNGAINGLTTINGSPYVPGGGGTTISSFQTASISSATISSINGLPYIPGGGGAVSNQFSTLFVSTLEFSTAVSVSSNVGYTIPIFIDHDFAQPGGATENDVIAIAVNGHNFDTGAIQNQIEMGCRGSGENYIMSYWPGQNLEDLTVDATNVRFRNSDGFSTFINQNPYGLITNAEINAPIVSAPALINVSSINGVSYPSDPIFGEFLTTATRTVSGANTPTVIPLDTAPIKSGINLDAGDVEFLTTGLYQYSFNLQLDKSGSGADICDIWLRLNGTDIQDTGSRVSVQGSSGQCLAVCSFFVQVNAGDKIAIVIASSDSSMSATYFPAWFVSSGDPYDRPAVPANIVQVKLIR